MSVVLLTLPFPPSTNMLFSQGLVGGVIRRFPSRKYKAWRREAAQTIMAARVPKTPGPVSILIVLTPPSKRARDIDNFQKALLDSLVEARVIDDDSNVQRISASWGSADKPGAHIEIRSAA